jgi:hypothetical protein
MGYKLTLEQKGEILERFYGGQTLRRINTTFRRRDCLPISAPTITRCIPRWAKSVDEALRYLMTSGNPNFSLQLGDVWECDELYASLKGRNVPVIVVRDLKTAFAPGHHLANSTTTEALKVALEEAKAVSHKCPTKFRCDGAAAYEDAVKEVFGNMTTLEVHKSQKKKGQNQSIEGFNSFLRRQFRRMRSLHSEATASDVIKGWFIDYNFVNICPSLINKTPAQAALINLEEGKNGWDVLLRLARKHEMETRITTDLAEKEHYYTNNKSITDFSVDQKESFGISIIEKPKALEENLMTQPKPQPPEPIYHNFRFELISKQKRQTTMTTFFMPNK